MEPYWQEAGADETFCKGFETFCLEDDSSCRCRDAIIDAEYLCRFTQGAQWNTETKECVVCDKDEEDYTTGKCVKKWVTKGWPEDIWREDKELEKACLD